MGIRGVRIRADVSADRGSRRTERRDPGRHAPRRRFRRVNVTGRKNVSVTQLDFEQRRREGFGTFKDSTEDREVTHRFARSSREFRRSSSRASTNSAFGLFTPASRSSTNNPAGGCPANVYIDGFAVGSRDSDFALERTDRGDRGVHPSGICAGAIHPASNNCGVVLVWTKLEFKKQTKSKAEAATATPRAAGVRRD